MRVLSSSATTTVLVIHNDPTSMSEKTDEAAANPLGLDLDSLKIKEEEPAATTSDSTSKDAPKSTEEDVTAEAKSTEETLKPDGPTEDATSPTTDSKPMSPTTAKEKKKPYVNPDRVKTGGAQRVCYILSHAVYEAFLT